MPPYLILARLLADALAQRRGRSMEIYLLDANSDGVEQIAAVLANRSGIDAIHVLSHGSQAQLRLGSSALSLDSMNNEHADELATIRSALSESADFLVYGCNFGNGQEGRAAANRLALLTGADIAASDDNTGASALDGDWELEYQTGALQTGIIVSGTARLNWEFILDTPAHEFFVPLTEQGIYDANEIILNEGAFGNVDTDVLSTVGITANRDGTVIYFDHHEDGFEADINVPVQATTEIWGDGDASNGIAPGFTVDVINSGDVIVLQNVVDTTDTTPPIQFDGGDRFASATGLAVTRAGWNVAFPGTVLAGTTEVAAVNDWGTNHTIPIGEDTPLFAVFEYTGLFVQAAHDNTRVDIDTDGDGTVDINVILDQGEIHHVDGGIQQGATVVGSDVIQVNLITGDRDSAVDSRWYRIKADTDWSNTYFSPAGSTAANAPASIVVYNPHATDIDINFETMAGTVTRTVSAGSTFSETLAVESTPSGARVTSADGRDFYAVLAMDTDATSTTYDWGYTLLSQEDLTEMALAGWAPGSSNLSGNGSPLWVTADADTTLYLDFDGDPTTGANVDPFGNRYDITRTIGRLESATIFDTVNNDNDQSQTRVLYR